MYEVLGLNKAFEVIHSFFQSIHFSFQIIKLWVLDTWGKCKSLNWHILNVCVHALPVYIFRRISFSDQKFHNLSLIFVLGLLVHDNKHLHRHFNPGLHVLIKVFECEYIHSIDVLIFQWRKYILSCEDEVLALLWRRLNVYHILAISAGHSVYLKAVLEDDLRAWDNVLC